MSRERREYCVEAWGGGEDGGGSDVGVGWGREVKGGGDIFLRMSCVDCDIVYSCSRNIA